MQISDKLGIVITTYNRSAFLKRTLNALLADDSPVKNCQITVQDNRSSDDTPNVVREFQAHHTNLHYRVNPYNLGISGNICKAMELADKEYHWNLGDDDYFNWQNWKEVETEIDNNTSVICVSNYIIPKQNMTRVDYQLLQMSFMPSIIIRTDLYTDTTIRNSFDNIFTLFPHLVPIITFLNTDGKIHVVSKEIVINGGDPRTDYSYLRGARPDIIFNRSRTMTWIVGYANIIANLNDRKLARQCFNTAIRVAITGYYAFLSQCLFAFRGRENMMQLADLSSQCGIFLRIALWVISIVQNTPLFFLLNRIRNFKCNLAQARAKLNQT